jgi:tRNA G10  N-methylase Trm11
MMNIVCILGRQPELSLAELERRFGSDSTTPFGHGAAVVETDSFDIQAVGGTLKAGRVIAELVPSDWQRLSRDVANRYVRELKGEGKLTLGISVYGKDIPARDVQRTGIVIKQALKKHGRSVRLVPNDGPALSTATSHHNKLGLSPNKLELMIVFGPRGIIIAESVGTQNITALANRDQNRPKRDAFVGMLPPKLALMMVNLSGITAAPRSEERITVLDPFCGTGVVLQEAALLGFDVYGSDLAEKMVDYSRANMDWLAAKHDIGTVRVEAGDAVEHTWHGPVGAVVAETYLGQPFSAPPAPDKLDKVKRVVDHIVKEFLLNIHGQLEPGTPLCLAVPAWRDGSGRLTYLPITKKVESLGYSFEPLAHVRHDALVYFREDQIVARQLLLLTRT